MSTDPRPTAPGARQAASGAHGRAEPLEPVHPAPDRVDHGDEDRAGDLSITTIDGVEGLRAPAVLRGLATSKEGLSADEASSRLRRFGPNSLEEEKENPLLKFLHYFWGPIPWMIEVAALLSAVMRDWSDFGIVFALLVINGGIGFSEEHRAADAMDALRSQLSPKARVLRSGTWQDLDATQLVPGDIVQMRLGDVIPADTYLLEGGYLSVDQSALTGESLPVTKQAGSTAYSGTVIKQGEMSAVVVTTGANTYFGRTAHLVAAAGSKSHFQEAVLRVGTFLIYIALALAVLLIVVELVRRVAFLHLIQFILILVVASIPVAMPAVLSVTMALGAMALSRRKAIVTRLESIEEMAGIDILCSDKTGTLTQNRLTLDRGVCFEAPDEVSLLEAGALASRPESADAIDSAVIEGLKERGGSTEGYRLEKFVPFDPVSKRTEATVVGDGGGRFKVTKGAPQVVIDLCGLTDAEAHRANESVTSFATKGYRTLGVARTTEGSWRFLGIIPMSDPPREDSKATIAEAHANGIVVKMVTGDNQAIGKEISTALGMGADIRVASSLFGKDGEAAGVDVGETVEEADGFAEVFPEHKYGIVKALQGRSHLVGMTGDGVNDAAALKQADVGIAVSGATGAAQAAADLVLTMPGLSVITGAVEEARRIFARMNSYTVYRIAMTIDIMVFVAAAMLVYDKYPLTALMIVLLALLDDLPIMTIAYDNTFLSPTPVRWQLPPTLSLSALLGVFSVLETFMMLVIGREASLATGQLQTLVFLQLLVGGHLMLLVTRARKSLWQPPYPSVPLFTAIVATQFFGVILCGFGVLVPKLAWSWIGVVWAYNIVGMTVLDAIKLLAGRWFGLRPAA